MYLACKQQVKLTKEEYLILRELCHVSKNLYNQALYEIRQEYFNSKTYLNYYDVVKRLQGTENYSILQAQISQQTLKIVDENFKSLKNEVDKIINKNKKGNANIDNNIDVDEDAEIFDLISQIQNEIKEIKNNKDNIFDLNKNLNNNKDKDKENNININKDINLDRNKIENEQKDNQDLYDTFDNFKKKYSFDGLGIKEEEIKRIFYNKKNDFFETMSEIIKRSYN
jgi:hypothetical protein